MSFEIRKGLNSGADNSEGNTSTCQQVWILGLETPTSSSYHIESNAPRHTKCRETFHHAYQRRLAAAIRVSRSGIAQKTRTARGCNDLTFQICVPLVPFVKKFHEC